MPPFGSGIDFRDVESCRDRILAENPLIQQDVYPKQVSGRYLFHSSLLTKKGANMEHGPVDVVVLAAGEPRFDGSILAELQRLAEGGTIRVLDAMLLVKGEDGNGLSLDIEDLPAEDAASLGFIDTGTRGLFDSEDSDILFEGMIPGSAVVALAIEHRWAVSLVNAIQDAGAELALDWRIPAVVVDEAYASKK